MPDSQSSQDVLDDFFKRVILTEAYITSYYRFTYVFTNVLEKMGIEYFAHSGTMLGLIRHKGIIPWDDDVDVMIEECFEDQLLKIVPELEKYGIILQKKICEHLYQFNCISQTISPEKSYLQIDVFVGKREIIDENVCLHFKTEEFKKWFPPRHIKIEDLYPLKEYVFGPIKLKGIRNYDDFLSRSGLALDEAIVARHLNFEQFKPEIESLKELGVYPIRDKYILNYRHEISIKEVVKGLHHYLCDGN